MTSKQAGTLYRRRWYDKHTQHAESIRLLEKSPPPLQTIIADGIILLAEQELSISLHAIKSLGHDKVLALHKSQNRRRALDKNPHLHRALNYLSILTEENRLFMANKIRQMNRLIIDYLQACLKAEWTPRQDDIQEMIRRFVTEHPSEAEAFLSTLKQRLYQEIQKKALKITPPATEMSEDRSMQIRGEEPRPPA